MKELEEVNCEVRNVIDIQHKFFTRSNNAEGDEAGSFNGSPVYNGFDSHCGGFLSDAKYAWLSHGSHLVILNTKSGESISSWTFRGKITCVCQFPAQPGELPLLLVGLDNEATRIKDSVGLLCIFDSTTSRVLRAIKMPVGVEQVCIVTGGADWEEFNDKRPDNILMQMDGIACVVLRNLHHLMIDLQRSVWEVLNDLSLVMDETSPAEIEFLTSKDSLHKNQSNKSKHMVCNLLNQRVEKHIGFNREEFESIGLLDEKLTNTIISSTKIGCLISGCLGRVIIWQNNGSVGWISLPVDETMIITHLALLEPADDPRPFYYLWVVFQDESLKVPSLLRMYALLFERKFCNKGTNLYFNLEVEPSLKFEFELDANDRVVNLSTIERETNLDQIESESKRGEDSLLLISTASRTLLFDLNQWYKEQMPRTISECKNPNSILASYNTKIRRTNTSNNEIVSCTYIPRSLQEFPNNTLSSSEELFYPNSLSLEWIELSMSKLTIWLTRGVQAELLHEIALAGPIVLTQPSEMFHKCLSVGLVPFNTEVSFSSDHNSQRDMLLSLCLEQHWATFLIRCAKEWSDGSAGYMYPSFLKWGIQRAATIKMIADHLCIPLFDQSGNNIGESEVKTLRFCYQQLECLSNVVSKLPLETNNLIKQRRALKRVSVYFQVLLWFYDVGLLPETQEFEEGSVSMSHTPKIPYPYEKLFHLYKEKRESVADKENKVEDMLFIDELITRECPSLNVQWQKESGDTSTNGYYPPPSLQSLLRSYLTDCNQEETDNLECKHQITNYLLMDLALLLQGSYPGVDQLVKYLSSFKMNPSIVKLTQAFWLLDHEDYNGFLDMMNGQLIFDSDVKDWHHKLVLRTLIRNNQHKLALMYLRIRKPPLSSVQDQSTLIDLSVEHGLVQSAFHHRPRSHYEQLLMCFFQSCKAYDKLSDILHLALDTEEEEMFVKFLEASKSEDIRLLYYLQRCRYMEANSGSFAVRFSGTNSKNDHSDMLNAYNATLPDIMKKFSMSMSKPNSNASLEPRYPRPMTYNNKNYQRISSIYETVIKKAKETYHRDEKSVIPFITAPCTTLKSHDDHININCVMSPKIVETHRKRTLDEVDNEEESDLRTPEKIKRRKLLDDGEAALNAAFSTPLVKRKVSRSDTRIETPHSILKIRQLIRNSTSPNVGPVQEVTDSPVSDKEKKINRQIRFNISQSKKNASHDGVSGDESFSTMNATEGSEEASFNSAVSEKSYTDSTVLSDGSYTCKNVYTARPRPSLRRTCLQIPTESFQDLKRRSSMNSRLEASNVLENSITNSPKAMPRASAGCTSRFSVSLHSPAILTPNSSYEIDTSKQFLEKPVRRTAKSSCIDASVSSVKSTEETSYLDVEEPMMIDKEEEAEELEELVEEEEEEDAILDTSSDVQITSPTIPKANHFKFNDNILNKYKNGDIPLDNGKQNEIIHKVQGHTDMENGEHFDITDDESSNCADAMVLALDKSADLSQASKTQASADNEYDALNITDDESDASIQAETKFAGNEEKDTDVSLHLEINNFRTGAAVDKASPSSVQYIKETINTSSIDEEFSLVRDNVSTRMTRSRRASSVTKEISSPSTLNSPSKIVTKTTTRTRRASSLMKEVLIASVAPTDEGTKRKRSSGSEDSSSSSTPRKTRGGKSSQVAKDVTPTEEQREEDTLTSTPRKTRGKSASTIKDISLVEEQGGQGLPVTSMPRNTRSRRSSLIGKNISLLEEEREDSSSDSLVPKRTRARRASSIAKDIHSVNEEGEKEPSNIGTPRKARGRRASSIAKDVHPVEEESKEESPSTSASRKARGRRASSIAKDVHPVEEESKEESPSTSASRKAKGRRASSVAKDIHPTEEESKEESPSTSTSRKAKGRRASSVAKDIHPVEEESKEESPSTSTSKKAKGRRASSVAKDVHLMEEKGEEDSQGTSTPRKIRNRKMSSVSNDTSPAEETEEVRVPVRRNTRRAASVQKEIPEPTKISRTLSSSSLGIETEDEKSTRSRSTRKRGSSVPKEVVEAPRTQRASSVASEVILENFEPPLEVTKGRHSMMSTVSSPAGNTRNRRSSIQSIPEELEEILSVPSKESNRKQATQIPRQRRAASVELSQSDSIRRTRSTRSKNILKETIVEEEVAKVETEVNAEASNTKKNVTKKTGISSDTIIEEEVTPKTKRGRKLSTKQDTNDQFSFSQPDETQNPPVDQKAIGEVPNYVFSPPHTRSKTTTSDNRD
ncbi:AT hook containing transcription factor 1 homolog [Nomia melanderi]|uniref:AT hook containing transcription factor 1 homolog n=1 Tax=Nomia melanderi TaxID=2448451 RepID=UPI0013040AFE|nr:protein ELYS [Nomia melanderi]